MNIQGTEKEVLGWRGVEGAAEAAELFRRAFDWSVTGLGRSPGRRTCGKKP
jgi:hypothetical protein